MKKFGFLLTLLVITLTFSSCNDDGYSVNNQWMASATFYETSDHYFLQTDDGWNYGPLYLIYQQKNTMMEIVSL